MRQPPVFNSSDHGTSTMDLKFNLSSSREMKTMVDEPGHTALQVDIVSQEPAFKRRVRRVGCLAAERARH